MLKKNDTQTPATVGQIDRRYTLKNSMCLDDVLEEPC